MVASSFVDMVSVATATTGTGTVTLGAAQTSYNGTGSLTNGAYYSYFIVDGPARETGQGLYTSAGTTLTRVLDSSTTGALLSLSGAAVVTIDVVSRDLSSLNFVDGQFFGDGSDGSVAVSGAVTLARDMYYTTLTLSAGAAINTAGYRIFCSVLLNLSNAPAGAIYNNANAGGNASGATGGAAPIAISVVGTFGTGTTTLGRNGFTGVGQAGAAGVLTTINPGGIQAGDLGAGGTGNGGAVAGGAGGTQSATTYIAGYPLWCFTASVGAPPSNMLTEASSRAGNAPSGAGSGGSGGGGGASGGGGPSVFIFAQTITRGASTVAGCIQAKGGAGGTGGNGTAGNSGGGAGGAGGSGGFVLIVYRFLTGTSAAGAVDVSGGAGGNGGNGVGTGLGGQGSGSGAAGALWVGNVATMTAVFTRATQTRNGVGTTATVTGGTGGASSSQQLAL